MCIIVGNAINNSQTNHIDDPKVSRTLGVRVTAAT